MKEPDNILDILDEATSLVQDRIDELRGRRCGTDEMPFLKDLRSLLELTENFRDD